MVIIGNKVKELIYYYYDLLGNFNGLFIRFINFFFVYFRGGIIGEINICKNGIIF